VDVDIADLIPEVLQRHPAITDVRLTGSRSEGDALPLSDWDFEVETGDFEAVARDLPELTASLAPLGQFWDPYSERANYILLLRGPVKVDLIFAGQRWEQAGPWEVGVETLARIDQHFWDWILWLAAKKQRGDDVLVRAELEKMQANLLAPMGVPAGPATVEEAVKAYVAARERREKEFGLRLPRELGLQVVRRLREEGFDV
jgi:hypothetical protein